jgi:transcriptional regulator with XRE-family HTH domain
MKLMGSYLKYEFQRMKAGLTNAEVASLTGLSQSTFSYWKSGKRSPKLDTLAKIATALGCDVKDLIGGYEKLGVYDKERAEFVMCPKVGDDVFEIRIEQTPAEVQTINRLLTYYRLMSDRDKSLLLDMARRMAVVDDKEEGDPDEEP